MPNYVQASELGAYFPASRVITLVEIAEPGETLFTMSPETATYLEDRIVNAESEADARLQGKFSLPVSPVPNRLKLAVGKIAIYYLYEDRSELWGGSSNPRQKDFDEQIEWLEGVKDSDLFTGSEGVIEDTGVLTAADGPCNRFAGGGIRDFG